MWRDEEISEADALHDIDLDVEMDDETSNELSGDVSDDDEIYLDDVNFENIEFESDTDDEESDQSDYAARLRDRRQINYANSNDTIVELNEEDSDESSTSSSSSSEISQIPFSVAEVVSQPRSTNQQQQNNSQHSQRSVDASAAIVATDQAQQINDDATNQSTSNDDAINQSTSNETNNAIPPDDTAAKVEPEEESKPNPLNDSSEVVDTCLICCEPFTSTSEHRVVSLKCGHIFGKECIERWLKLKDSKKRCPKCNTINNKNDIRIIYAKSIVSIDTSELDQTKKDLDEIRKQCLLYEQQVEELKFDLGLKENENMHLKREISTKDELIKRFKSNTSQVESNLNQAKMKSLNKEPFARLQSIDLKADGCRMIVITEVLGYIVISQPTSPNSLIKGFGVRRISLSNFNSSDFIFLHHSQIKDMALHPIDALLLTASFDKQVKLVNLITKQLVATFTLDAKPWCVTWNKNVVNLFYVGLNNGYLLECSTLTNTVLKKINTCLGVPIKLIRYLNHNQNTNRVNLLITSIKTSFFCEIKSNHKSSALNSNEEESVISMKPLPISGPIISTNIIGDSNSGNILLTVRPSNKYQNNIQHYVSCFVCV